MGVSAIFPCTEGLSATIFLEATPTYLRYEKDAFQSLILIPSYSDWHERVRKAVVSRLPPLPLNRNGYACVV